MATPDELLTRLEKIFQSFGQFCQRRGSVSEADTRHQIIDRILHEVLLWPRQNVNCEERTDVGYMDYTLYGTSRPLIVIEAKKAGDSWSIPYGKLIKKTYQLSGVIQKERNINEAIIQVQSYCNANGVRYAVASNGYSFIIFRAISEGSPWREGKALVFQGAKDILENFNAFLEALLYENILNGSLDNIFVPKLGLDRIFDKPISHITNEDALYGRNIISSLLQPYIEKFFGDISSQSSEEIFKSCYVYTEALKEMDKNLKAVLRDEIPIYAEKDGFQELILSPDGGELAKRIKLSSEKKSIGGSVLLMGGIGCGKSTYLRRLIRLLSSEQSNNRIIIIYIDYLGYSPDLLNLSNFTYDIIARNLMKHKSIISRDVLELIYKDEIDLLKQTKLYAIKDENKIVEKIGDFLHHKIQDNVSFSENTLKALLSANVIPVVIFDNVDQLRLNIQIDIFATAQYFARQIKSFTVLALREESYCTARMQKVFTAYAIQRYHISSPNFQKMIKLRIINSLKEIASDELDTIYVSGRKVTKPDLINFLKMVYTNLFRPDKIIMKLIEAISFGDMRFALNLLCTFMTSGTTDAGKILRTYLNDGGYTVPFHEFVKSITLGEYRHYKESRSFILNLFDVQPEFNASHFTGLRLLKYLSENKNVSYPEGIGFVDLNSIFSIFDDIFHNYGDVRRTILKFIGLNRQLIESDTKMTDSIEGSSCVRITPAGLFYHDILFKEFSYLDLVWQDTPINNSGLAHDLAQRINATDLNDRFKRVSMFIDYLEEEELQEMDRYGLVAIKSPISDNIMVHVKNSFAQQIRYIKSKKRSS